MAIAPPRRIVREVQAIIREIDSYLRRHPAVLWGVPALKCLAFAAIFEEGAVTCLRVLLAEFVASMDPAIDRLFNRLLSLIEGVDTMACANFHRTGTKVQGPGLCCAQVGVAGGLVAPPPGTTLPAYIPGQADAGQIPAGRIVQVTDAAGHCASCMIVGSTSKKHPGKPVLKFVRGGPACPTAGTGCCAL